MNRKIPCALLALFLCGILLSPALSGCSAKENNQTDRVEIPIEDLVAANDLETLCTKYGAVTYQLKNSSEKDGYSSTSAYWLQDGELVCCMTSNLDGDPDLFYTPVAEFYRWDGMTHVSCPVPNTGVSNTPAPPYPNGFLSNSDDNDTLQDCKKTKDGYSFTQTYFYDENSSTQCTYTTDRDFVIIGCQSTTKGENYEELSTLSIEFSQTPLRLPAFAVADPVTLSLVSMSGGKETTAEITLPRNCYLSVYGAESTIVSWDEFGAKPLEDEIVVSDDLTLYASEVGNSSAG